MKKKVVCFLVVVWMLNLITGCGQKNEQEGNTVNQTIIQKGEGETNDVIVTEENKLPIVEEPMKLTIWQTNYGPTIIKSFDEIECYKEIEKRTGIDIEYLHPASGQEKEQFNIMVASGDYPDVISYNWESYPGGALKAVEDKVIIDLTDLINQYAPNYKKILEEDPELDMGQRTYTGSILTFAGMKDDLKLNAYYGFQLRRDWLNNLGLEVPTTIDEWYTVLKAFKEQDPNGNNKEDEIPFVDDKNASFLNFSAAWGVLNGFHPSIDGKIVYGPAQPEYKEFLQVMRQWYQEGLIDSEYITMARKNLDAKMTDNVVGAYCGYTGSQMGKYMQILSETNDLADIAPVPWPIGPAGKPYVGFDILKKRVEIANGMAITTSNENVKETVKLLDYFYSDEALLLTNFGIEGQSYEVKDGKRVFTDNIMNNPDKDPMSAITQFATPQWGHDKLMMIEAYEQINQRLPQQKEGAEVWTEGDTSLLTLSMALTPEQAKTCADIMSEVSTLQDEVFTKIIMGVESIELYDEYLKTIKKMGIDEAVEIYQEAYDRMGK